MRKTHRLLCACLVIVLLLCTAPGARADYYSDWVALRQATLKSTEDLLRLYITPELRTDQYVKIAYNTYNTIKYGTINAVNIVSMLFELNDILRSEAINVLSGYTQTLKIMVDSQKFVFEKAREDEDAGLPAADRKAAFEDFTAQMKESLNDDIGFMDAFSADHPVFLTLNPTYKNHLQDSRREAVSLKSAVPSYYYIYLAERAEYARKKLTLPFSYNLTNQRAGWHAAAGKTLWSAR